jgi:uncharacterized membrane protein YdbT with pleckstrin-like domain
MDSEPGEQIFFQGHPSWRGILSFYVKGLGIAIVVGIIVGVITRIAGSSVSVPGVIIAVLVVFVAVLLIGFVRRVATTYTISNQRLTIRTGILNRKMRETRLVRVQNVNTDQSLLDRLLRVGKVDFDTAGSDDYDFSFHAVADPQGIVRTVDRALHRTEGQGQDSSV